MSVKIDIEKSRAAKVMRRITGLISLLLIEDKRATTTAATAIDIGTFQFTAPSLDSDQKRLSKS